MAKHQKELFKKSSLPSKKLPFIWLPGKNSAFMYSIHISILEGLNQSKISYNSYIPCFRISLGISLHNNLMNYSIPLHSFSDNAKLSAELNVGKFMLETLQAFNQPVSDSKIYTSDQMNIDLLDTPNFNLNMLSLMVKKKYESQTYTNMNTHDMPQAAERQSIPTIKLLRTSSIVNWGVQSSNQYKLTSVFNKHQNIEKSPNSLANALAGMDLSYSSPNAEGNTVRASDLQKFAYIILSKSILKLSISNSFAISISI